jgi:GT2 family glycosyltransferase
VRGPRISVVIPTYRRPERLPRLVEALERQTLPPGEWEAIIVEDCGEDGTIELLHRLADATPIDLRVASTPQNGGPAAARNVGWRMARAPLIAFTDDDCAPTPGWLAAGLDALEGDPRLGILQGLTTADRSSGEPDTIRTVVREVLEPSPWFEGCNLFMRKEALEASGGFDEVIAWAGEETAMAWKLLESGWERGWAPAAEVVHDVEERPLRWHLRNRYLEGHAVVIAARHPTIRSTWWRPWAIEKRGALFAVAVGAGLGALVTRRRWPLVFATPYVVELFPRHTLPPVRPVLESAAYRVMSDAASLSGKVVEGLRSRTVVL